MWTKQTRGRMADIARKTKRYPSGLTDEKWERIAPLMPKPARRGRRRRVDLHEIVNAVRYLVRSGCGWEMLPVHFGPWQTVYWWFRRLMRRFLFQAIHNLCLMWRSQAGRARGVSLGGSDRQPVSRGSERQNNGLRRRQEDRRSQAPHCRGHRRAAVDGQPPRPTSPTAPAPRRSSTASPSAGPQAPVRRRCLRSAQAHGQGRLPRLRH